MASLAIVWVSCAQPVLAAPKLQLGGTWSMQGGVTGTYDQPDDQSTYYTSPPWYSGVLVPTVRADWSHDTSSPGGGSWNFYTYASGGVSLTTTSAVVTWIDVTRGDRISPSTTNVPGYPIGSPRWCCMRNSQASGSVCGISYGWWDLWPGLVIGGPVAKSWAAQSALDSGSQNAYCAGSWAYKLAQVSLISVETTGVYKVSTRQSQYLWQHGTWSGVQGQIETTTTYSPTSNLYAMSAYTGQIYAPDWLYGSAFVQQHRGYLIEGHGYTTDADLALAIWDGSDLASIGSWTGYGSGDPVGDGAPLPTSPDDLGGWIDDIGDALGGLGDWLWPLEIIGAW